MALPLIPSRHYAFTTTIEDVWAAVDALALAAASIYKANSTAIIVNYSISGVDVYTSSISIIKI